jgi:putative PIN family toxin of toxin-antitoxin system
MVFLQGAGRATGPAAACLQLAEAGVVTLYLSEDLFAELSDVLTRPRSRQRFPILTDEYVDQFLRRVRTCGETVADVPAVVALERDPKDEAYINLAIAVEADYLVSRDKDLLALMGAGRIPGTSFRDLYPFLTILDPVEFLRAVRADVASRPRQRPAE